MGSLVLGTHRTCGKIFDHLLKHVRPPEVFCALQGDRRFEWCVPHESPFGVSLWAKLVNSVIALIIHEL